MRFGNNNPGEGAMIYMTYGSIAKTMNTSKKMIADICFEAELLRTYKTDIPPILRAKLIQVKKKVKRWAKL